MPPPLDLEVYPTDLCFRELRSAFTEIFSLGSTVIEQYHSSGEGQALLSVATSATEPRTAEITATSSPFTNYEFRFDMSMARLEGQWPPKQSLKDRLYEWTKTKEESVKVLDIPDGPLPITKTEPTLSEAITFLQYTLSQTWKTLTRQLPDADAKFDDILGVLRDAQGQMRGHWDRRADDCLPDISPGEREVHQWDSERQTE